MFTSAQWSLPTQTRYKLCVSSLMFGKMISPLYTNYIPTCRNVSILSGCFKILVWHVLHMYMLDLVEGLDWCRMSPPPPHFQNDPVFCYWPVVYNNSNKFCSSFFPSTSSNCVLLMNVPILMICWVRTSLFILIIIWKTKFIVMPTEQF